MQRVWNNENLVLRQALNPAVQTGTTNIDSYDSLSGQYYEDCQAVLSIGAVTDTGAITLAVQHRETTSDAWAPLNDRDGNAVQLVLDENAADSVQRLSYSPNTARRYRRYVLTVAATNALCGLVEVLCADVVQQSNA